MNLLTLFKAFKRAEDEKRYARQERGSTFGIRVNTDPNARRYQRYDRLSLKLDERILETLGDEAKYEDMDRVCIICGWLEESCECSRRGWGKGNFVLVKKSKYKGD